MSRNKKAIFNQAISLAKQNDITELPQSFRLANEGDFSIAKKTYLATSKTPSSSIR
ncbi:MAG: hypothetical protein ACQEP8_04690 [Chlamydiota bacterium]